MLQFPAPPLIVGQQFQNWTWDGVKWAPTPFTGVTVSATAPDPKLGGLWWNTASLSLMLWNGSAWIRATGPTTTSSNTAPSDPLDGDLWMDTSQSPPATYIWNGTNWTAVAPGTTTPIIAALVNAVRELTERLDAMEKKHG
ncbi:MAG: hypothetical protein C5B54_00065 [Acidobacteria bacterium]|nr:MAG: hypothetical protein C5B54_00065 [Acidobacteriota bacterium]